MTKLSIKDYAWIAFIALLATAGILTVLYGLYLMGW
jgi:hypothetical protein